MILNELGKLIEDITDCEGNFYVPNASLNTRWKRAGEDFCLKPYLWLFQRYIIYHCRKQRIRWTLALSKRGSFMYPGYQHFGDACYLCITEYFLQFLCSLNCNFLSFCFFFFLGQHWKLQSNNAAIIPQTLYRLNCQVLACNSSIQNEHHRVLEKNWHLIVSYLAWIWGKRGDWILYFNSFIPFQSVSSTVFFF